MTHMEVLNEDYELHTPHTPVRSHTHTRTFTCTHALSPAVTWRSWPDSATTIERDSPDRHIHIRYSTIKTLFLPSSLPLSPSHFS